MNSISIVVPAKNEAKNLTLWLPDLLAWGEYDELIIVDDGSEDDTYQVAEKYGAKVVRHPQSMGNGAAVKSGARAATCRFIVFMDADGQHQVKDIPKLISKIQDQGWNMVVGARSRKGQASFFRFCANSFYNWFASLVSDQRINDLTSGFRLVEREKFLQFLHLLPNGFSYPTTSTMAFLRAGYSVGFQDIDVRKRQGKSHIRPIRDGLRFCLIIFKITTLYSPLKIFVPVAVVHFLLGLSRYLYTYIEMGRFTNMSALLMAAGVQIFLIGLVSEQITSLMYQSKSEIDQG